MLKVTEAISLELEVDLQASLKTQLFPKRKKDLQREDPGPAQGMGALTLLIIGLAV